MISELGFFSPEAREDEKVIRADYAGLFTLAEKVSREFIRLLGSAKLDPHLEKNLLINALALRSLELFQSTINMLGQGAVPAAKVVCRSFIESVFKLSALQMSSEGMDMYLAQSHASRLKKLQGFQRYKAMRNLPPNSRMDEEILKLKTKKMANPTVSKWAEVGGMQDFYNVYYVVLNDDIHTSVEALNHYFDQSSDTLLNFGPTAKGIFPVGSICHRALFVGLEKYALFQGVLVNLVDYSHENDLLEQKYSERLSKSSASEPPV